MTDRIISGILYEDNYASGDYQDVHLVDLSKRQVVPLLEATEENLKGYGFLVDPDEYFSKKVQPILRQWPKEGWREVASGTGSGGGTIKGQFITSTHEDYYLATNTALDNRYVIGRVPQIKNKENTNSILVREANYHPDGGQIFVPLTQDKEIKFILLLAKEGDDIKPEDFRAFLFKGKKGFHINAKVWHKPPYTLSGDLIFANEQGAVHAVVCADIYAEHGKYLEICL